MVPSTWTTASGKFNPSASFFKNDNRSNIGINGATVYASSSGSGSDSSVLTGTESSECSPPSISMPHIPKFATADGRESQNSNSNGNSNGNSQHSPQRSVDRTVNSSVELRIGEIEDPVKRNKFYKTIKKKGIKKHYTIDDNWDSNSAGTVVSDMSISAASYILDLAQQKESRTKDREEEALEEALDLYGTWLTEGKTDDKNIFIMILHEVKKEFKLKYAAADKHQDALLDAALEEEIQRRERLKLQQEPEERIASGRSLQKKAAASAAAPQKGEGIGIGIGIGSVSGYHANGASNRRSVTRIDEIIEKNASQKHMDVNWDSDDDSHANHRNKVSSRSNNSDLPNEWKEPYVVGGNGEGSKPKSAQAVKRKKSLRSLFSCFGGGKINSEVVPPSTPPKNGYRKGTKSSEAMVSVDRHQDRHQDRRQDLHHEDVDPILAPAGHEDSVSMFSRLRIKLSEENAQLRKEEEKWWKKIGSVETKEEKWWKKINEAQQESILFDKSAHTEKNVSATKTKEKRDKLDAKTKTSAESNADPMTPARTISTANPDTNGTTPTLRPAKKEKPSRRKSTSPSKNDADVGADVATSTTKKEKSEKKKPGSARKRRNSMATSDCNPSKNLKELNELLQEENTKKESGEKSKEKEAKHEKKKKKKSVEDVAEDEKNQLKIQEHEQQISEARDSFPLDVKPSRSKDSKDSSKDKKKKKKNKPDDDEKNAAPLRSKSLKLDNDREKLSREGGNSARVLDVYGPEKALKIPKKKKSRRTSVDTSKPKSLNNDDVAEDESELKSSNAPIKKKKSKEKSSGNSLFEKDMKKKKKSDASLLTDDAVYGDVESKEGSDKCVFEGSDASQDSGSTVNVLSAVHGAKSAEPVVELQ